MTIGASIERWAELIAALRLFDADLAEKWHDSIALEADSGDWVAFGKALDVYKEPSD